MNTKTQVMVGSDICKVKYLTNDELVCTTPKKPVPNQTIYPGGRGVQVEVLTNENIFYNDTLSDGSILIFFKLSFILLLNLFAVKVNLVSFLKQFP